MNPKIDQLLRLGDNALILSQQLSRLCGKGPALEEDMALTNVALDLLGQARLWLGYAAELEGAGRDEDRLAFHRDVHQFRNGTLVEQPNGNYADTLMRQFYFDSWHYFVLRELAGHDDPRVAAIAAKSLKEVTYHLRRSGDLIVRLGDGSAESHAKTQAAADALWMYTGELFLQRESLRAPWLEHVGQVFAEATLVMPAADAWMQKGGAGVHTEHLGFILAEMQFLQRAYPGASW